MLQQVIDHWKVESRDDAAGKRAGERARHHGGNHSVERTDGEREILQQPDQHDGDCGESERQRGGERNVTDPEPESEDRGVRGNDDRTAEPRNGASWSFRPTPGASQPIERRRIAIGIRTIAIVEANEGPRVDQIYVAL